MGHSLCSITLLELMYARLFLGGYCVVQQRTMQCYFAVFLTLCVCDVRWIAKQLYFQLVENQTFINSQRSI